MPRAAIGITTGEFRFGGPSGFRFTFRMSPIWAKMEREFASVALEILEEEMKSIAREMGQEMLRQIKRFASPRDYTGRLSDARVPANKGTWRYWIGSPPGAGGGASKTGWYVTVGLHQPSDVSPRVGRPVRDYAHAIELGAKPRYPLGKMARERIKSWAARKGLTATQAHYIARAIFQKGTDHYPYFAPAARATAGAATGVLEEGGENWRDRVEAHFTG